jgi:hypothetical protein
MVAMSNATERDRRGRQARLLAQRFRWETVGRSLADLYGEVGVSRRIREAAV